MKRLAHQFHADICGGEPASIAHRFLNGFVEISTHERRPNVRLRSPDATSS
jgi:hypothetical protein